MITAGRFHLTALKAKGLHSLFVVKPPESFQASLHGRLDSARCSSKASINRCDSEPGGKEARRRAVAGLQRWRKVLMLSSDHDRLAQPEAGTWLCNQRWDNLHLNVQTV